MATRELTKEQIDWYRNRYFTYINLDSEIAKVEYLAATSKEFYTRYGYKLKEVVSQLLKAMKLQKD